MNAALVIWVIGWLFTDALLTDDNKLTDLKALFNFFVDLMIWPVSLGKAIRHYLKTGELS